MWFGILGPLEVRDGDRTIDLGRPKQRAVLAALLVEANRVVALDRLIDLLWDGDPPPSATGALQVYISGLRQALEPERAPRTWGQYLITKPPGYSLQVDSEQLDAARFEKLAAQGHRLVEQGRAAVARRALADALDLWRGPVLADFALEPFAQGEAARLEPLRAMALEDRIAADLALGRHAAVTAELEGLVTQQPLRERLWALLMLSLYRSERQSDALRAFARARAVLREELGIEPGPVLRRLEGDILDHAPSLDWVPPEDQGRLTTARAIRRDLVGREKELRVLDRFLARARAGRGGVVLVSGEPGIGKTSLVQELVACAAEDGALVAWGRCHEGGGAPSFWPWVQVIRDLLRRGERDALARALARGAAEIAQISPEVKEVVRDFEPPPVLDPAAARFRLYEAINDLVAELAVHNTVVLVLDDLHWADVPSLKLLEFLAGRIADTGALIVGTFRDVDPAVGGPLADTLGALARHPSLARVALDGLNQDECGVFITRAFGVEPSSAVAASIHARTDGNPFFVGELARLLASEGSLERQTPPADHVPVGVRDVIRRRLRQLPERTTDLLAQAAVLGRELDLETVAIAGRIEADDAATQFDAAVDLNILVADATTAGTYSFVHALTQDTILGEISLSRRAKLHARAAAALRVVHGDDDGRAVELAHHLYEATPVIGVEEAYAAALRAAEVSQRRLDYEQAEKQLRRAIELTGRMAPGAERWNRELAAQHRLAALLSTTDGYQSPAVAVVWERAHELCAELGDSAEVLASLSGLARLTRTRGQYDLSIGLGEQLLALGESSFSGAFLGAGHEACGHVKLFVGRLAEAAAHLTESVKLAETPSAERDAMVVLHSGIASRAYLSCVRWLLGDEEAAEELMAAARELADASGHHLSKAIALLYSTKLASMQGRPKETLQWTVKVERLCRNVPIGPLEPVRVLLAGWARARLGDFQAGEAGLARSIAQLRGAEWRLAFSYFFALKADAHRAAGHLDQACAAVREGLAEAEAIGEHYYEPELYRLAGELTLARWPDRADDAEAWLRRAVTAAREQGSVAWERRAGASLARVTSSRH